MLKAIAPAVAVFCLCAGPLASHAAAQQVFVRDSNTALAARPVPGEGGWITLDGQLGGGVDACTDRAGTTHVVTLGQDGAIFMKRHVHGAWESWRSLGGSFTSDPSVACAPDGVGVFARGPDGAVQFKMFDAANPTAPYASLGAEIIGGPDATASGPSQFDVVVRGTDNAFWYSRVNGGRLEGWRPIGGQFTSDPAIVAVERNGRTYLEVFGRGTDHALWHGGIEPAGVTHFVSRGGALGGAPDAMSSGPQRMEIAVRWADDTVRTIMLRGGWSAWESAGGRTTADVAITGAATGSANTTPAPPAPAGNAARFRVMIGGFRVARETVDDLLERDGARDEVFFIPTTFQVKRDGSLPSGFNVVVSTSPVMGQRRNDARIQAGEATTTGGLQSGDNFPPEPWVDTMPGPLSRVFEGVLRQGEDAAVIIPTLWEWDGNDDMAARYVSEVQRRKPQVAQIVAELIGNPRVTADRSTFVFAQNLGLSQVHEWDGGPANRPIGVLRAGNNRVTFTPKAFVLTYEAAELIRRTEFEDALRIRTLRRGEPPPDFSRIGPAPLGVFTIQYQEADEFHGDYIIYLRVERCPSLDSCG